MKPREKASLNYSEALKEKFASHPQVRRIARHRQVPKHIFNAQKEQRTIRERQKRKYEHYESKIFNCYFHLLTFLIFFAESQDVAFIPKKELCHLFQKGKSMLFESNTRKSNYSYIFIHFYMIFSK